ncbi:LysR family transcriptional regulator [Pseudomonas sp. FP2309]|uniref:LysR family transcriptional regulator n=1 Tax=Pseudomonas sp. FP2309 TaxID=2954091 RepID=UPI0027373238|nr:LysR family transcriptional regulator [Pseudomonas sp. FP2309]WLH66128.1 LysR substrate-binding domain-containing protein [Pseudomonas sp. FP2309]
MDYLAALTAFVESANENSFSKAAGRLGIKASTVSRYIKDLEQDLGIALFNRSTRKLALTEGGQTFLHHAQKVLFELSEARAATSALNQNPRGRLKVSLPPAFARHHILPLVGEFIGRYPDITLDLSLEESHVDLIATGIDLAIRIGRLADSNLKARKLAEVKTFLCVSPAFSTRYPHPDCPDQLPVNTLIAGRESPEALIWANANEQVSLPVGAALWINDLDARLIAVSNGLGMALLPDWLASASLREGRLVRWLPDWKVKSAQESCAVWFVYPPKRIVSSKVRCFIDFMAERLADPPVWQR